MLRVGIECSKRHHLPNQMVHILSIWDSIFLLYHNKKACILEFYNFYLFNWNMSIGEDRIKYVFFFNELDTIFFSMGNTNNKKQNNKIIQK